MSGTSRASVGPGRWDYERYGGHRAWESARHRRQHVPLWQRRRYTRSDGFPRLHVLRAGKPEHLLDNHCQALIADVQASPSRSG
ncbi:hypothetical protein [Streptomyces sp. NPDC005476]|uniref:hypothetical protein n=1 Tax=Streptomyces sp. NPDC005476 TaxID=3156882 RepID=UPI0034525EEC